MNIELVPFVLNEPRSNPSAEVFVSQAAMRIRSRQDFQIGSLRTFKRWRMILQRTGHSLIGSSS
jgi:hypothetical protein